MTREAALHCSLATTCFTCTVPTMHKVRRYKFNTEKKPCTAFPLVHWFSIHKTIKITILSLSNLKGWISWLNNRLYTYIHVCMHIKAVLFIAQLQDFLRLQLPCVVDNNGPMGKAYTTVTHFGHSASSA